MQALVELIAGFVALLAAAALSQFGLDLDAPEKPKREIHRVRDCDEGRASSAMFAATAEPTREC